MLKESIIDNSFIDDKLNRKEVAEHFKNILLNTDLNVFSLVAPWGCGKTYFIQNLMKIMDDDSVNILYNAWESDFYDSPLIPLLVELLNKLECCYEKTELEEDIKSVKEVVKKICNKTSFQTGFNFGIANCSANFDPNKKMIESEYIELKEFIQNFKNKIKFIQEKIDKKIIIFIDELDRCNPIYMIKTLEVIKHLFGIPNIVFVLAVDKAQIENSVRTIFGINQGMENGYLRKFIDVEFQLPEPNIINFISFHLDKIWNKINYFIDNNKYYNYHLQRIIDGFGYQRDVEHAKEQKYITNLIFQTLNVLNFSLRDIEKYFMRLTLILDGFHDNDVLLIEPTIVFNALSMNNKNDTNNDLISNFDIYLQKINPRFLPIWHGLFKNSYKQIYSNYRSQLGTVEVDTTKSNVLQLFEFLYTNNFGDIDAQEQYIKSYPLKIKFINNFNSL